MEKLNMGEVITKTRSDGLAIDIELLLLPTMKLSLCKDKDSNNIKLSVMDTVISNTQLDGEIDHEILVSFIRELIKIKNTLEYDMKNKEK